jgi:hypothetical protein
MFHWTAGVEKCSRIILTAEVAVAVDYSAVSGVSGFVIVSAK